MKCLTITTAAALLTFTGTAMAGFVYFETDATGNPANGFVSNDDRDVTFSDTMGSDLLLSDRFGAQGDGVSLAVFYDDAGRLGMDFGTNISHISPDFGNDDPVVGFRPFAWLVGYNNHVEVASVHFRSNGDDIMNESISLSGGNFDRVEFYYGDAAGVEINLIALVDNISTTLVPGPGTFALLGLGGLAITRRRR